MSEPPKKSDLAAQVAWLYYVANHTQQQIAEELNVSRPTVQRLVASATESGYVQVRINHPTSDCMEVARRLKDRFGLKVCEVAPIEPNGDARSLRAIAVLGATLAERYLSRGNLEVLAFGSGRTLKAVVDEIAEFRLPNLKILSLAGAIALDGSFNRYDCGLRMADKTEGKHFMLPVPVVAATLADKEAWLRHPLHKVVDELYGRAEAAFIGVGTIGPGSPLAEDGFITEQNVQELINIGAVAESLGWPLDRNGRVIPSPLTDRVTSLTPDQMAKIPVIAVAGGSRKAAAIVAVLRGGFVSGLVTDFETAHLILSIADR